MTETAAMQPPRERYVCSCSRLADTAQLRSALSAQAVMDLVARNVDFGCDQIVNLAQYVKTGSLKA
jgi:hypothetical protein